MQIDADFRDVSPRAVTEVVCGLLVSHVLAGLYTPVQNTHGDLASGLFLPMNIIILPHPNFRPPLQTKEGFGPHPPTPVPHTQLSVIVKSLGEPWGFDPQSNPFNCGGKTRSLERIWDSCGIGFYVPWHSKCLGLCHFGFQGNHIEAFILLFSAGGLPYVGGLLFVSL